jgi:UDP-2-acetamido-2,6-beta-L-arabino-hexul-4-ose reductase
MSQSICIEPLRLPSDPRGVVIEPIGPEVLPRQRNVHVALTEPGCVRGNHYHLYGQEVTVVLGPALFRYRLDGETRDFVVPDGKAYRFSIPPGIPHAFQNTGQTSMVLVGFNSEAHNPARPDVVRETLIP